MIIIFLSFILLHGSYCFYFYCFNFIIIILHSLSLSSISSLSLGLLAADNLTLDPKWFTRRPEELRPSEFIDLTLELYGERVDIGMDDNGGSNSIDSGGSGSGSSNSIAIDDDTTSSPPAPAPPMKIWRQSLSILKKMEKKSQEEMEIKQQQEKNKELGEDGSLDTKIDGEEDK
jgi:hypothetical protein